MIKSKKRARHSSSFFFLYFFQQLQKKPGNTSGPENQPWKRAKQQKTTKAEPDINTRGRVFCVVTAKQPNQRVKRATCMTNESKQTKRHDW